MHQNLWNRQRLPATSRALGGPPGLGRPPRPPRPQGAGAAASPNPRARLGRAGAPAALIRGRVAALRVGGLGPPRSSRPAGAGWKAPSRPRRPEPPRRAAGASVLRRAPPPVPREEGPPSCGPGPAGGASRAASPRGPHRSSSGDALAALGRPWGCGGTAGSPPSRTAPGPGKSRQATVRGGREGCPCTPCPSGSGTCPRP